VETVDKLAQESLAALRVRAIEELIPSPPVDVIRLRRSIQRGFATQWRRHAAPVLGTGGMGLENSGLENTQADKIRFLAEMYLRACSSMIVLSDRCPLPLRLQIRCPRLLPLPRAIVLLAAPRIFSSLEWFLPARVHRQLALMATMIGLIDLLLDEATAAGPEEAGQIALLLTAEVEPHSPLQTTLRNLVCALREGETGWQALYWTTGLRHAMRKYCQEEALAATGQTDPSGMGFRSAGIEAAIGGMWYVVGPFLGLDNNDGALRRENWNAQQRWMADTSLLVQMIDDWIDQDEDRAVRSTAVLSRDWTLEGMRELYEKTVVDLCLLLDKSGVRNKTIRKIFEDLYADYLHAGLDAMKNGVAV
jgi:hypothetical protein